MRIKRLKEKIQLLFEDLTAHRAAYEDGDREPTDDENAKADLIMDEIDKLQRDLKVEERIVAKENQIAGGTPPAISAPGSAQGVAPSGIKVVTEPQDRGFEDMGTFLQAVYRAEDVNVKQDPRLMEVRAASGMSEGVVADGGYAVQHDLMSGILEEATATGVLLPMIDKAPIGLNSNGIKVNYIDETSRVDGSRGGGVQAYWTGEAAAFTSSKPKLGQISMSLEKLTGLMYATEELLADATALGNRAQKDFGTELGFKLDDSIINGTGAGMPQGIMNAAAKISVAKESGQTAKTIVVENLYKMYARMYSAGKRNGVWFINGDIWPQLFGLVQSPTTGAIPMFIPPGGLAGNPYGTILGRPIIEIEQCQTLGTPGDIIFADMSQYMLIDKGNPKFAASMHVRFLYDEMAFRVTYRANGQSKWPSAKTPFKGTDTRSPFIVLAVRA